MERDRPSKTIQLKYATDRVLATGMLAALVPLFASIGLAIKADDGGPVFFRQTRPGREGRPFDVWKFRTMVVDADRFMDARGRVKGSRITGVGSLLRFSSLDELPQLVNIAKGEMSFVGPRPALMEHLSRYTEEQRGRLRMKPGVTGMAQVNGRNTITWSRRIEYDNWYIDHYSPWLDLRILLKTVKVALLRQGIVVDRNPDFADDLPRSDEDRG